MQSILSDNQKKLLKALSGEKVVADTFYLSGGTALSEFYLPSSAKRRKPRL
jgi:predicted nucleotidyltransferase component of viral defense system